MSRMTTVLVLIFLSASAIFGQAVAIGSVSGTVSDQSGSSVPNATVKMTQTDRGTVHTGNTDAEGHYTFNDLPVGPYRLEVSANGFKGYAQTDRKSTRLNSSHLGISYAVFCLKKKKN